MICGSDGILAKPTNDNGKIANGSHARHKNPITFMFPNTHVGCSLSTNLEQKSFCLQAP
jgi:hypothetical protein